MLVEMAILTPVVLLMLLGTLEFGRSFQVWMQLTYASSVGAREAAVGASAADVGSAVRANLPDLNQANLTVTVTNPQGPAGSDVTVDLAYRHTLLTGFFTTFFPDGWVDLSAAATHRLE